MLIESIMQEVSTRMPLGVTQIENADLGWEGSKQEIFMVKILERKNEEKKVQQ